MNPEAEIPNPPLSSQTSSGDSSFLGGKGTRNGGWNPAELPLAEKRMLLAELLRERAHQESCFPLSYGQRGLWFLWQMDRGNAAYHVFFPARIRARVNVPAFRFSLQTLLDRHPSLRVTFEERDGELRQRVHDSAVLALEVHDTVSWSEDALRERVEDEAHRPFDLVRGPLLRACLFERSAEDYVFLLTAHHIIGDFWSLVLLIEEMRTLYPAACAGVERTLPAPPSHYRQFVRWQRELLDSPDGERQRSYWERQLAGVSPVLELPLDHPRPARFTHRGASVPFRLEAGLTRQLKALAAAAGVTPYVVLLAAFQTLLCRHSGQDDFTIGSPFAGRNRAEFERVVGYFINMLPLRALLSDNPSFHSLLGRVGGSVLEALEHQDYPFASLVERLHLKRDPSRAPLVQVSFTLEKVHRPVGMSSWSIFTPDSAVRLHVGGMPAEPYRVEQRTCQLDLELVLEEGDGTFHGMLRYNEDLFDAATIERLATHYRVLLQNAVMQPDLRVSELPLLTTEEERQLLYEWNETATDYQFDQCLHHLFERRACESPTAIALRYGERTLSYGEVNVWANRLAHRLHQSGVGRETLVPLYVERSPEWIVAMIGVLKAGGAFVPLDMESPAERLRDVLSETRAPVVLAQRSLAQRLSALETPIVIIEECQHDTGDPSESGQPLRDAATPSDLAYVIYTSGSTGRPKGVMIEHRSIVNTILWHQDAMTIRADDRVLLLVSHVFDASLCIAFPALAGGAELLFVPPGEESDPTRILDRMERDAVTVLPILPRMLRLLLGERFRQASRDLRLVFCGGEAMPADLPERLFELREVQLFNLYGPTEAAIDATYWPCRLGERQAFVPIGRPIANVQAYVLDPQRHPVPIGVVGELYVGGAGVARGYWNDAELTKERFTPDPFRPQPDARLYRTGDRCRWRADGALEFLGRLDQQVKLRGYRIEIGAIEAALATHPAVREAVVLLRGTNDNPRLAAYLTTRADAESPSKESLRRYLRGRLPECHIPSSFVLLPSLPLTPSGKVDRNALPKPVFERPANLTFVEPRTEVEKFVAGLWRDLVDVQQISLHDNFFELGGNSLQAASLANRLQEKLHTPISTVLVFDAPTLADFVDRLTKAHGERLSILFPVESPEAPKVDGVNLPMSASVGQRAPWHPLVCLQPKGPRPPCYIVHPPGGIVVCYQALAHHVGEERPFFGIRARGTVDKSELPASVEEMAGEYVSAIRAAQPCGPYHLGGWSMGGVIAYEMAQQLRANGQTVGLLALLDTTIPFNPANRALAEDAEQSARAYGLDLTLEELGRLGPDEQLPYLWRHVRRLGLIAEDTPLELAQRILEDLKSLFHAHVQLCAAYEIRPYPGAIDLFRPSESPVVVDAARDRNWGRLASALEVHFVPGHHHSMVQEPQVRVLAERFRTCLQRIETTL